MAVGPIQFLDQRLPEIWSASTDWTTHEVRAILCDDSQLLSTDFAGVSGDALYSDLTGELSTGGGYTQGGVLVDNFSTTLNTVSTHFGVLDADNISWPALTKSGIAYCVLLDFTYSDPLILGFFELNVGGTVDSTGQDLNVLWNANGLFRIKRSGE